MSKTYYIEVTSWPVENGKFEAQAIVSLKKDMSDWVLGESVGSAPNERFIQGRAIRNALDDIEKR